MNILEVSNPKDEKKHYRISIEVIDGKQYVMLNSQAGEGVGITEHDLYNMFDRYFTDTF